MEIFNTLSNKKEKLVKLKTGFLKLFVCGPTVNDYVHIGHARTFTVFDAFVKYLRAIKIKIFYLQNITDIDDKIIARARQERTSPQAIAAKYQKIYFNNMKALGIDSVNRYAPTTKYISQVVQQVKKLIKKRHVYEIPNDGYYFNIMTFPNYGKLSHRTIIQAEDSVSRIDESVNKKNKGDFCVWKFSKPGEPSWKTELGVGRPGWHIEDTAITEHFFGPQYDIHGGGIDLKFPHHEAEIAQQESASGKKPFVRIWMHVGSLTVNGKKMSNSLKNFILISDFLKKYPPEILRLLILSYHYRSPIDYTDELVSQIKKSFQNIEEFLGKLKLASSLKNKKTKSFEIKSIIDVMDKNFSKALNDDFNTPKAIAIIFNLISSWQNQIWHFNENQAKEITNFIKKKLSILGIDLKPKKIPPKIKNLMKKRELLRKNKQFIQADLLRKKIERLGYRIEDTPVGPLILPN